MVVLAALAACSGQCDDGGPCRVSGGYYLAQGPDDWNGRTELPMLLYFHGYNNTAEGKIDSAAVRDFREAGWLTVLPQGKNDTWAHTGSPSQARDELPFIQAVLDDAHERWPVTQVAVAGFSQGSSMAFDVGCYLPGEVDALFGASGTFWRPEPARCDGPLPVRYTHGRDDGVMPLNGRPIGAYHQGSVADSFVALRATNGCPDDPDEVVEVGPETCELWSTCDSGQPLMWCMYDGGHRLPTGWAGRMLDWFATVR